MQNIDKYIFLKLQFQKTFNIIIIHNLLCNLFKYNFIIIFMFRKQMK